MSLIVMAAHNRRGDAPRPVRHQQRDGPPRWVSRSKINYRDEFNPMRLPQPGIWRKKKGGASGPAHGERKGSAESIYLLFPGAFPGNSRSINILSRVSSAAIPTPAPPLREAAPEMN